MKIVSLENADTNTNTLNIKLNGTMTVAELFRNADVARFAAGAAIDSIEAIDNAPASLIKRGGDTRGLENYQLTDDSVIELNAFAENKEVKAHTKGKVTVKLGGVSNPHTINIYCGETVVSQLVTDKLAAALNRSRSEILGMKVRINGMESTFSSVLQNEDKVTFEPRKAGDNGADGVYITVYDADDNSRDFEAQEGESLREFICRELCADVFEDVGADIDCVIANLVEVDDHEVQDCSGAVIDAILNAPATKYADICFNLEFLSQEDTDEDAYSIAVTIAVTDAAGVTKPFAFPEDSDETVAAFLERIGANKANLLEIDDQRMNSLKSSAVKDAILESDISLYSRMTLQGFTFPSEAPQEFTAEGVSEGASQEFSAEGVEETPVCGKVTLTRGNTERVEMLIKEGETTLDDLLFSDKVLNKWAMTRGQMGTMSIFVNGVQVYKTDITPCIGDIVNVDPPKCGNNGVK